MKLRLLSTRNLALIAVLAFAAFCGGALRGETLEWTRKLASTDWDVSYGVSADGIGNVYTAGVTRGNLGGPHAGGLDDAWLAKHDAAGNLLWARQLGTSSADYSLAVSTDSLGSIYISGASRGNLGGTNVGGLDAFVAKYDGAGNLAWTRQVGTAANDESRGVSADGLGNVYITGYTSGSLGGPNAGSDDAFLSKYDGSGSLLWTRQLGTSSRDWSNGVSADILGNVYITGFTYGSLAAPNAGNEDVFVSKYDSAGTLQWTRQIGTALGNGGRAVSADGLGNVYIAGYTNGSLGGDLNAGGNDAFISKLDTAGTILWTHQIGTTVDDLGYGVSADKLGNIFISGETSGSLGGPQAGGGDAWVAKYNSGGALISKLQIGSTVSDIGWGVSADNLGNAYVTGETWGTLGGPYLGVGNDTFLARFSSIPEPSTVLLTIFGAFFVMLIQAWRKGSGSK